MIRDPITLNPSPTAVVTKDEASISTNADHPDPEEDWHDDWTISDSEGATSEGTAHARLTLTSPRTTPRARQWPSTLTRRRSWRVCQQKCCGFITSSTTFRSERFEPWHDLGVVNPKLAKCPSPACSACLYGKMTRQGLEVQTQESTKKQVLFCLKTW